MKNTNTLSFAAMLVALAGAPLLGGCNEPSVADAAPSKDAAVQVEVVEAKIAEVPDVIALDGTLAAFRRAELSPLVAGHVSKVEVERGDVVEAGDPLVVLRATNLKLQASSAWARAQAQREQLGIDGKKAFDVESVPAVIAAKTDLDLAQDNLRRMTALHASGAVDDRTFTQAKAAVDAAEARYLASKQQASGGYASYRALSAEAALRADDAKNTTVTAPFAGAVVRRMAEVGEFVSPQQPVVELVDASKLRLELEVPERSVELIRVGQKATIEVDGTDQRLEGTVAFMAAAINPERRTLTIEVLADNAETKVHAGHFARARLELGSKRKLVEVPKSVLQERAGVYRLYLVEDGIAHARIVELVEVRDDVAYVRGDLPAGSAIVVNPPATVADGVAVRAE